MGALCCITRDWKAALSPYPKRWGQVCHWNGQLHPLYDQLMFDIKAKGYLQVDETPLKVLESDKKGACHQGYYWVYHSPMDDITLFDYQPTRGWWPPKACWTASGVTCKQMDMPYPSYILWARAFSKASRTASFGYS
ncbi:Transposase IS66 family protein [bacterium A37T11]|nr:Transposase IS66 family protein [bacterium A37T11]